jgi:hypothetical protein
MPTGMDHIADTNRAEFVRLARLYPLPQFVKSAELETVFAPKNLQDSVYADPRYRQFPCQDAPSTFLSALFYQEKRAEFHPKDQRRIEERLDKYIAYWDIKTAVDQMKARWAELHKAAEDNLPDSAFAYVWTDDTGVKDRRLRLTNAMEVKAAADWLHQYRDRLPFEHRHVMAKKILVKQASFGVGLGENTEFIQRQAGLGVCEPTEVVQMIEQRAALAKNAQLRDHFLKMAGTVRTLPRRALQPEMLIKLATTMDQLDRQLGLAGRAESYTGVVKRPEDVIFKATFDKIASERQAVVATTSGKVYEKQAFKKLAMSAIKDLFGDEFAGLVTDPLGDLDTEKLAEQVAALPRPDAELFDALLDENGIYPSLQKAASAGVGFSNEDMQAWAAAYQTV